MYSYATLHGNPKDPSSLAATDMYKICRESMLFDSLMTDVGITQADVYLIFQAEVHANRMDIKKGSNLKVDTAKQKDNGERIDFNQFLSCLQRISAVTYPHASCEEESFKQLLIDNILPAGVRRKPVDISEVMFSEPISNLLHYFEDCLIQLFKHYAGLAVNKARTKNMLKTTSSNSTTFDAHEQDINARRKAKAKTRSNSDDIDSDEEDGDHRLQYFGLDVKLDYEEFIRFVTDFGLTISTSLTSLDIGDIYLSVIYFQNFEPNLRGLEFGEFCEALVRCALKAFQNHPKVPNDRKLKNLFLYMWKHSQVTMKEQMQNLRLNPVGTDSLKAGLVRGGAILNERFISMWGADGHVDYTQLEEEEKHGLHKTHLDFHERSMLSSMTINNTEDGDEGSEGDNSNAGDDHVFVNLSADEDVGDERISAVQLKELLQAKPHLAKMLVKCVRNSGLEDALGFEAK